MTHAVALLLASAPAFAQQAASPASAASAPAGAEATKTSRDGQAAQAIVITAGKREQRLRDTAGSVSVESGAALEARGARDAEDLVKTIPGLIFNKNANAERSMLTIRGISTVTFNNLIQGTAGLYVEDVPFNDALFPASNPDVAPFDLDRIEVLKGPQGALYGSMSLGGALRYVLNKPNLKQTEASALFNVESVAHGGTGYSAYSMVNLPVIKDTLGLRAVAFKRKDAGYLDKPALGRKDVNELDQSGGRLLAAWQVVPGWRVTGIYQEQTTDLKDSGDLRDAALAADKLESTSGLVTPSRSKWRFGNLQIEGDVGNGLKLSSNTGWVKKNFNTFGDQTAALGIWPTFFGSPPFPQVKNQLPASADSTSQELRIASSAKPLSFVVGAFYQKIDFDIRSIISVPGGPGATYLPIAPFLFTQSSPGVFTDLIVDYSSPGTSKEQALFADLEYDFGNGWTAGVGARHTKTKQSYQVHSDIPLSGPPDTLNLANEESATTPKFSLKRKLADDGLWYASIARGFRFGGISPGADPYKSDKVTNYETGLRLNLTRSTTLDMALFFVDWKDSQIITLDNAGGSTIRNAGKARVKGVEAALNTRSGPATFGASVTYTDARTREAFPSLFVFDTNTVLSSTPSGASLPGTPKVQAAATGGYQFEGPFGSSGRASFVAAYQGKRKGNTLALPVDLPEMVTLDLRTSFSLGHAELALFANNVLDERGLVAANKPAAAAPTGYLPIRPRSLGMSLRLDY